MAEATVRIKYTLVTPGGKTYSLVLRHSAEMSDDPTENEVVGLLRGLTEPAKHRVEKAFAKSVELSARNGWIDPADAARREAG
jgi:hypothetical protein